MAAAQVDAADNGGCGLSVGGSVTHPEEQGIVADLEGRSVEALGLGFAPMPDIVQDGEALATDFFGFADAPSVGVAGGKTDLAGFDLAAALLVEPVHATEFFELLGE